MTVRTGGEQKQCPANDMGECGSYSLLHHLKVDLLHVYLLAELGREFGSPQELHVHSRRHLVRWPS